MKNLIPRFDKWKIPHDNFYYMYWLGRRFELTIAKGEFGLRITKYDSSL